MKVILKLFKEYGNTLEQLKVKDYFIKVMKNLS